MSLAEFGLSGSVATKGHSSDADVYDKFGLSNVDNMEFIDSPWGMSSDEN